MPVTGSTQKNLSLKYYYEPSMSRLVTAEGICDIELSFQFSVVCGNPS